MKDIKTFSYFCLLLLLIKASYSASSKFYFTGAFHLTVESFSFHNNSTSNSTQIRSDLKLQSEELTTIGSNLLPSNEDHDDLTKSNSEEETGEYTLTKEEELLVFYKGIDIDYSHNESLDDAPNNQFISAPGCPASGVKTSNHSYHYNMNTWVHLGNPPRCFLVGSKGPCPAGMVVGLQSNSFVGKCKCTCFVKLYEYMSKDKEDYLANPFLDEQQGFCFNGHNHYASDRDTKCYQLLTQGPCKYNEAFMYNNDTKLPECRERECPEIDDQDGRFGYQFLHEGSCAKLLDGCEEGVKDFTQEEERSLKVIGTTETNPNPDCVFRNESIETRGYGGYNGGFITENSCKDLKLMYSKILQKCVPYYRANREWVG